MSLLWGDSRTFIASLWKGLLVVVFYFSILWHYMGLTKIGTRSSFCLVELVGKALFTYLEFSFGVFDVVYMEGE